MGHLQTSRLISAPVSEVFEFITNLERLPPTLAPDLAVDFPNGVPQIAEHAEFPLVYSRLGVNARVVLRVEELTTNERFAYRQVSGVFKSWQHVQTVREHDAKTTLLTDFVDFKLPLGILGAIFDDLVIRKDMQRILNARLARIDDYFVTLGKDRGFGKSSYQARETGFGS